MFALFKGMSVQLDIPEFQVNPPLQLLMEGVIVEDRPRRGRPPKEQREMLVVDEVPVPPHLVA